MALTEQTLRDIMYYCRAECEDAEERKLFLDLYQSAAEYLQNAGVSEPEADTPRWNEWCLCVKALVLDAYDRRGGSVDGTVSENPALRRRINQLKLTEPAPVDTAVDAVSESDTTDEEAGGDG